MFSFVKRLSEREHQLNNKATVLCVDSLYGTAVKLNRPQGDGQADPGSMMGSSVRPGTVLLVGAVLFSSLVGVFFGFYPARKAASLNPIDALHYE